MSYIYIYIYIYIYDISSLRVNSTISSSGYIVAALCGRMVSE